MILYTYYRLCEPYCEVEGRIQQHTVLGCPTSLTESDRKELGDLLISMINEGIGM